MDPHKDQFEYPSHQPRYASGVTEAPQPVHGHTHAPWPEYDKLAEALAKAQGDFKTITRDKEVTIRPKKQADGYQPPPYKFKYADLASILEAVRPALAQNGLSLVQFTAGNVLITRLMHASGQSIESRATIPDHKGELKNLGAAMTYLRRYQVSALLCIAADDDIDEDGQDGGQNGQQSTEGGQQQKAPPVITKAQFTVIDKAIKQNKIDLPAFLGWLGVDALERLPADQFDRAMAGINRKKGEAQQSAAAEHQPTE